MSYSCRFRSLINKMPRLAESHRAFQGSHRAFSVNLIRHGEMLREHGYALIAMGRSADLKDMEVAAQSLMGNVDTPYNGKGGAARAHIGNSRFYDIRAAVPSYLPVMFHNEMAYSASFPRMVALAMKQPAAEGGVTLLADMRKVTELLSESLKGKLRILGVRYLRLLHDESVPQREFRSSWQGAFQTTDISEAFEKGNTATSILKWHNDGKRLLHDLWSPVFHHHPVHGEILVTSILTRHGWWLDEHGTFGKLPLHERPYHCVWGDGSEFSRAEYDELQRAYHESTTPIQLAEGEVVVVDNLRVAHGRTPFRDGEGVKRTLGLLLSDMVERSPSKCPPDAFISQLAKEHSAAAAGLNLHIE